MIGCVTENGVEYIAKLEHFRDLMSENTYEALIEFINNERTPYQDRIDDLESELSSAEEKYEMLDNENDDLRDYNDGLIEEKRSLEEQIAALKEELDELKTK